MPTPSIQTLRTDAQQVLNLDSISAVRSVVAATLANANAGTPLNPNLTTQQLWNEFYQIVTQPKSDIESIIANQLMKFMYAPPAPGGAGANGQVIFNDGGVLAGDAGLTYNKTTDALTITGDLTVRTNKLKVDASGVGIGTASPAYVADVSVATTDGLRVKNTLATSAYFNRFHISNDTGINFIGYGPSYGGGTILGLGVGSNSIFSDAAAPFGIATTVNQPLVFGINGTTAMTLNSTGLGVGVTPSAWNATYNVLDIGQNGSISGRTSTNNTVDIVSNGFRDSGGTWVYKLAASSAASRYQIDGGSGSHLWYNGVAGTAGNTIAGFSTPIMTLDSNGNLILLSSNTPATLSTNGQLTVNATSNTNLRFSYRGSDGTTRVANITLA